MLETELKFLVSPVDLSRLRTLPVLRERIKGARAHHSKTTYFDTFSQDLWKHGFSLRIRSSGGHLIQTLKQERSSFIERGEWEREIPSPAKGAPLRPDLASLEDTPLANMIDDAIRASLRPTFEIDVERTVFPWTLGKALIEVAIVRGEIRGIEAPRQTLAISELELEVKRGGGEAAFALARTLAAQAPLHLSLISKAERGQLLLAGAVAAPVRPSKPHLSDDMTIRAAFRTICRACLHDFMLNVTALDGADPVEAVHQGRIALRRLRAALALVKPLTLDGDYAKMNDELRWLARIFGAARDRDVMRAGGPVPQGSVASGAADDFLQWLETRRIAAHETVRAAVGSERWRMFLIDFSEWVEDAPWRDQSLDDDRHAMTRFVCKELRRRRDALSEMAHDLASLDRGAQHKVRLNAKKLRYMALFFVGLSSVADHKRMNRLLICLDKLQTALGDLRDSEARRRMAEAEIRLWRSATRNIDAASLAAAERLAALIGDDGESFRKALKACAKLVKINPF